VIPQRDDKSVNPVDIRLDQITSLVEVPLADRDARRFTLPKSEVLRREVWTKQLKGQTMVRKLVLWQTNKAEDQESGVSDFPAYVSAFTDFSPNRKTPLEREIRISNSREQIDELWVGLTTEYIVKGWTRQGLAAVRPAAGSLLPAGRDASGLPPLLPGSSKTSTWRSPFTSQ
jgi:hypothetical protein